VFIQGGEDTRRPTLCADDIYTFNNQTYDINNPRDTVFVPSPNGCDSMIIIDLQFISIGERVVEPMLCSSDTYFSPINNRTYDISEPQDTILKPGPFGCDSLIIINLQFVDPPERPVDLILCSGDTYTSPINNMVYDEDFPRDTLFVPSPDLCDSMIIIDLTFNDLEVKPDITHNGCSGDNHTVEVDGTIYDESNPSGVDTIPVSGAIVACDTIVEVDLIFKPTFDIPIDFVRNSGDMFSIEVNGTIYDESNPSDTLNLIASNGCDSVIRINLIYIAGTVDSLVDLRCQGDSSSVMIGNSTYDELNPFGIDTFLRPGMPDSFFITRLTYLSPGILSVSETSTAGGDFSITLNGVTYDESRPTGQDTIPNGAANGCDSIIDVSLTFVDALITEFDTTICMGDPFSRTVGNSIYDQSNPAGIDTLQTSGGIDSLVSTELTFVGPSTRDITESRCIGDNFEIPVGNSLYNEANPSGVDTLFGQSATGCDSIVVTNLTFNSDVIRQNPVQLCTGETVTVGNSTYSADNLSGMDTIPSINGCDTIVVTNVTLELITVDICSTPDCDGQGDGTVKIFNLSPGTSLTATVDGQDFPFTDSVIIDNLAAGQYTVDVASNPQCMISGFVEVEAGGGETLGIDVTEVGDSLMLDISFTGVIDGITWEAASGIVCADCSSLIVDGTTANVYTLNVTDEMGCTYTAVLNVGDIPNVNPDPAQYFISNAITDLGDAGNQRLFLQTVDPTILSYDLAVFSRWGSLVFDGRNLTPNQAGQGWDGFFGNQIVESGVYIYRVILNLSDGSTETDFGDVVYLK